MHNRTQAGSRNKGWRRAYFQRNWEFKPMMASTTVINIKVIINIATSDENYDQRVSAAL